MLRDFKFLRRNSSKKDEIENVPVNHGDSAEMHASTDSSRAPLNAIQDPNPPNPRPEEEGVSTRGRIDRTPTNPSLRTPDKHIFASSAKNQRFGWPQKSDSSMIAKESRDDTMSVSRGGLVNATPRPSRTIGRANSGYSESNSTQSTPTKSVSKPPNSGLRGKIDGNMTRAGNFAALYKGMPSAAGGLATTVVNTVEVPHFDLKEDPSFWMDHNVQVLIRVRPLNSTERSLYSYNRCLKQESAQSITWIGQPETRFTFDHVACETVDQEKLFRMAGLPMVENCLSGYNSCMFAYGQTGSGKTYTMLGEIDDIEVKPSAHRGMTPRIFEFLFARIQAEEESRRDEKLKYNCKCSFLEIYNEQITDLLDPSSTNLLLREDIKKAVYVENLSEFEVCTVSDILKLLIQGSLNRKVAATNMNRESSRSHSVFTCVIECRWEKDSTTNLRFARLNLVDLAGSERQKTSGAEGERLKEAASINKSLSTLGHVIMILVDVANGKPKHVPYRDSRLTFLLQDSLGGNSKTMIIANVSPSTCCAAETLNTLKFAQRAKLIQNNAVVNEDSTGDIVELQHQLRLLKEELSLLKRQNVSRSLSFGSTSVKDTVQLQDNDFTEMTDEMNQPEGDDSSGYESRGIVRLSTKQLKSLETTLAGALRREKMAEISTKKLEAEIEHLNRLVRQREEDTRGTKMMLRFREDKIQRMESLLGGFLPPDSYLQEENRVLSEENHLLQSKLDKNPEVTRFALENIRLLEQLRGFQEFYEEGERQILLGEVSKLRDQLCQFLEGTTKQHNDPSLKIQPQEAMRIIEENDSLHLELKNTLNGLEECRHNLNSCLEENEKLRSYHFQDSLRAAPTETHTTMWNELDGVHATLTMNNAEEIMNLQLELDILKIMLKEERSSLSDTEERVVHLNSNLHLAEVNLSLVRKQYEDASNELKEAKSILEALESQQILSINELEDLRRSDSHHVKLLREQGLEIIALKKQLNRRELRDHPTNCSESENSIVQVKLEKMQNSLEKAKRLNMWYQSDRAFQTSNEEEMEEIRQQVEAETAEVIVCMEAELSTLQQQLQVCHLQETEMKNNVKCLENELKELQIKLCLMTEENKCLHGECEEKDGELRTMVEQWELLACEIEEHLADGHDSLINASDQLELISSTFPQKRVLISGKVAKLARIIAEKDLLIEELGRCLDDANNKRSEVEHMLKSLKGAVMVINESHQQECNEKEKEILMLSSELRAKMSLNNLIALKHHEIQLTELEEVNLRKDTLLSNQAAMIEKADQEIQSLRRDVTEFGKTCAELQHKLYQEEKRACTMEHELKDIEENEITRTREKLSELKSGVCALSSCMKMHDRSPDSNNTQEAYGSTNADTNPQALDLHLLEDVKNDVSESSFKFGESTDDKEDLKSRSCKDTFCRDITVILLRKEIESALRSLHKVEAEMAKLKDEEEISMSNKQRSQESINFLTIQILALQEAIDDFGKKFDLKIEAVNNKLQAFDQIVQEAGSLWYQTKECLVSEVGEAKIIAAQKAAEASCIFAKFEEAQDTMEEADIMINGLLIANETMKLDIERLKKDEVVLTDERDTFIDQVHSLQSLSDLKDQQLEDLEKQLCSNVLETRDILADLEGTFELLQTSFNENFAFLSLNFFSMKPLALDSMKLVRSWLEDVWSEIVVKDCAVSVLHLCHMGILLETVTGLNTENGLLQHGLCESNSVMADLRIRNSRSSRELEMCRTLKGKLLADIKNSFERISMKEEETEEFTAKLMTFGKKILDLQLQEELMLERSSYVGSQLAILMKELDLNNANFAASFSDQERLLQEKEEALKSQAELFIIELWSKDLESLILASELEEIYCQKDHAERESSLFGAALENLKLQMILSKLDAELGEHTIVAKEEELSLLLKEIEEVERVRWDLSSRLSLSDSKIRDMDEANKALGNEIKLLKDAACANDMLRSQINEVTESRLRLLNQNQELEVQCQKLQEDLKMNEVALESYLSQNSDLDHQNKRFQKDICALEISSSELCNELDKKKAELSEMILFEEENSSLKLELERLKRENSLILQELEEKKSEVESSLCSVDTSDTENRRLKDEICSLETLNSSLQSDVEMKAAKLRDLQHSQSVIVEDLCSKTLDLQTSTEKTNELKGENNLLRNELRSHRKYWKDSLTISSLSIVKCIDSEETVHNKARRLFDDLSRENSTVFNKMFHEMFETIDKAAMAIAELESLEVNAKELVSENMMLQAELVRKEDVLKGLLFDLSLLQETASSTKDQKDEMEEMEASLEALEDELALKSGELDEAVAHRQALEVQLQEKIEMISDLKLDLEKEKKSLELLSFENMDLRAHVKENIADKCSIEDELIQRKKMTESLEMELSEMSNALGQMNDMIESLMVNLNDITSERDQISMDVLSLKENLEKAQAQADANEAIAVEAQQIAESRKIHVEDKEVEVKLLEKSVEELERTINVLENKVEIVKQEAERQRLQREELESELHAVNHQMQNVRNADGDIRRHLDEKEKDLQQAILHIHSLEKDIVYKDAEISQFKAHVSELNLHAEAQATEFKQKFKALESMADQVRPEGHFSHVANSSANKLEKNAAKSRGSGSPFKCIGLGLGQQIKSERDEELTVASQRIEELESLAVSRQKEVFALNARLAAAESMTHDVIRDLLGVKLDMNNCVSLWDNQQVQKIAEKAQLDNSDFQVKDQEVVKLKQQLNEFIKERQGWLEEIDRKQAEMVAAQVALEKLCQRDQLLKTENEMLKIENTNHKKKLMELEGEINKLSGQQNLQQRIHHHAKIREENNMLKIQNEDLSGRLRRTEVVLSRVKEELAHYRASIGKGPHINFDEERRLNNKLKEIEEDRLQLAQKLLNLCTNVLKAAGITKPLADVSPNDAEEALKQLTNKLTSLEKELQNFKFKNRIAGERNKLSELLPQSPPLSLRIGENCQSPRRVSQTQFLSSLDR
ncbi:phragmoplast orienting kinesin 2 [Tripterygium wilfordii]|uniref:Phragmoplast orienting kinesin 2 n=1 Tax=Tripterygium wilfordii TaxID=458696 RepID=A0A7J7DHC5_TRIWF|nr:phragmoplast orienting kinesin 2 [Tripterygium wilfordii]